MSKDATPKCKHMQYTQQLEHLPTGLETVDDVADLIEKKLGPARYAVILHDQDTDDRGAPVKPHLHAMVCFENARHITAVAKKLGDNPQQFEKWDGNADNGFAYLVHATTKARKAGKHQYDPAEVKANFDFPALMEKISAEVEQAKAKRQADADLDMNVMLNLLYTGGITKKELEAQLSGSQYARYHRQIADVNAKRLEMEAEKWREEMRAKNAEITVIWITGAAGSGKTSLAKAYAEKRGEPYYITGSTRDIFQDYNGEHTLIIDELRPKVLTYADLLRITDPHGIENHVMLPARYNDRAIAADLIIVTTPFSPAQFYIKQVGAQVLPTGSICDDNPDGQEQLFRRITVTLLLDGTYIRAMEYSIRGHMFVPIPGTERPNPYSGRARKEPPNKMMDFYNSMFDD